MDTENKGALKLLKEKLMVHPPVDKDPRLLSSRQKNLVLLGLALCAGSPGFSSTIYFPGLPDITADLNAPSIATTLTAALFVLAMGIAPVFWSAISDHFKLRRLLLILSMIIFAISSLGCAFINSIWGLVVLRCVQSVGSSCGQSLGAGVIADCFAIEERGAAFGKFFFGVFVGPLIGPIIGGFLIMSDLTWRATFWFCVAFALFNLLYIIFVFPETYRDSEKFDAKLPTASSVTSSNSSTATIENLAEIMDQNKDMKPETSIRMNQEKAVVTPPLRKRMNPIGPFLLLRHPFVFIAGFISAVAFSSMFTIETIIPDLYEELYGFESWKTGLSYLGAGVGNLLGAVVGAQLSDRLLLRARARRGGVAVVEDRLTFNLWPSFVFMIFGLLLFGWATAYRLSVWVPIIAFGIQTFGMNQIMTSTSAYIVDGLPAKEASSATAAAHLLRMVLSCILTLVANPMVAAVGPGWTCVLLAGLAVLGVSLLVILHFYGAKLRRWSGFNDNENE